jgi:hypothetical protein
VATPALEEEALEAQSTVDVSLAAGPWTQQWLGWLVAAGGMKCGTHT